MCGIFGITITKESTVRPHYKKILRSLFILSEPRMKELNDKHNKYITNII